MPPTARRSVVAAGVALLAWCVASSASAQQAKPEFLRHYRAGEKAEALGNWDEARAEFEKARKIQDLPGPYRWLASIAKTQKRYEDCLTEAVGYLKRAPASAQAATVRTMHAACRKELGRIEFRGDMGAGGALAITSNVEGATVRLNGLKYGATPMPPRAVALGKVEVELSAARHLDKKVEVEILEGIVIDANIELEIDPNAPPDPTIGDQKEEITIGWVVFAVDPPDAVITLDGKHPTADAKGRVEYAPGLYDTTVEAPGHEPWKRRVRVVRGQERTLHIELREESTVEGYQRWGYVSLGVAALATGAGFYFGSKEAAAAERAQDIWDTETQRPPSPDTSDLIPISTRADLAAEVDDANKWRTLSLVSYGVGAAALGVSIYYFLKHRPAQREGFQLPVAVSPIPDGAGGVAGVGATFSTEVDW